MSGTLTAEQVEAYHRDGYLYPVPVLDADEVEDLRAAFKSFEDRWSDDTDHLPRPYAHYVRDGMQVISPAADRICRHPAVLDVVEAILGPDLLVWTCEFLVKEPHSPQMLTIHQDAHYWGFGPLDGLTTAWIALSEVTDANGAMHFVRGSHRLGNVDHHDTFGVDNILSRGQEVTVAHDPADEVVVALQPGEISLHHGLMFHGSGPNTSDVRRVAVAVRYLDPSVVHFGDHNDFATPVRGDCSRTTLELLPVPAEDFDPVTLPAHERMMRTHDLTLGAGAEQPMVFDGERSGAVTGAS
ncbi:MAG: phytanoyl-CoA dioxygenase family protein [Actinomycetota bacterium]|nr:phytanoyl-CoA dioxygenase family protein [Actinomycetota bacterium]